MKNFDPLGDLLFSLSYRLIENLYDNVRMQIAKKLQFLITTSLESDQLFAGK